MKMIDELIEEAMTHIASLKRLVRRIEPQGEKLPDTFASLKYWEGYWEGYKDALEEIEDRLKEVGK